MKELLFNIQQSVQSVQITDILDIAIVALVIYKLISFVRKTNFVRVTKGILLLLVLMWLSDFWQLNVINFFLGKTMELGFLALVVLFQPELRRLLEQVGSSSIAVIFTKSASASDNVNIENVIAQTVLACTEMSKNKVGALIIFERSVVLNDPIKTGTVVNADVSAELLGNIFYPKAPLHDGAVIIRGGRINAAGCMLPLSTNPNLSRELGMRHRAGIGMSEASDAISIIVSEETGSISVATDGLLKRHLSSGTFERLLYNELIGAEEKNEKQAFRFLKLKPKEKK